MASPAVSPTSFGLSSSRSPSAASTASTCFSGATSAIASAVDRVIPVLGWSELPSGANCPVGVVLGDDDDKGSRVHLFRPLRLRDIEIKNRIAVSPMCQYTATDGFVSDWHLVNLGQFAVGGAGLIVMEATAVAANGRITAYDTGIYYQEHVPHLKRIVDFVHTQNAKIGIQLAHAGRKASTLPPFLQPVSAAPLAPAGTSLTSGWPDDVVGPSALAWDQGYCLPREMTLAEIKETIASFVTATNRADEAGFDLIELHGAHGYLISSFLSPLSNQRTDDYGGSLANRMRFCLEIAQAVRDAFPANKPVGIRISCDDHVDGGWTIDDSVVLGRELKKIGLDFIDCSSGGQDPRQTEKLTKIAHLHGYQVPYAARLKKEVGDASFLVSTVGMLMDPQHTETIIADGQADFVSLAREFLRDPHWPLRAARELNVDISWPPQYQRAKRPTLAQEAAKQRERDQQQHKAVVHQTVVEVRAPTVSNEQTVRKD